MAKGRMINQKITADKKIHTLSCDTSRLAFTWLVSFADVEGRTYGDPAIVKSMLFPRRSDITAEQMESYLQEWEAAELIIWYEADDDLWIQFPKFEDNQKGLRKDREAPSNIPAPKLRTNSGQTPDEIPVKFNRTEQNITEKNRKEEFAVVVRYFENEIQMITPKMADTLDDALDDYSKDWILEAIDIAVEANVRKWNYIEGVLKNWKSNGKDNGRGKTKHDGGAGPEVRI